MEKIVRQSLLFDFYGELLTEHQKQIYEDVVMNDLSYSEIARDSGISRQGVYDLIKRINRILNEYEDKLHLVDQFLKTRKLAEEIHTLADSYLAGHDINDIHEIRRLSAEIMDLQN